MKDLGENPFRAIGIAIWELAWWSLVILGTWGVGVWLGIWIGSGHLPSPGWVLWAPVLSLIAWLGYPIVLLGLGTTAVAWYLPTQSESRRLAIGAVVVNMAVWTALGAYLSWS